MTPHKDLADLFRADPKAFRSAVNALKAEALPAGAEPPRTKYPLVMGGVLEHLGARNLEPIDAVPTPLPTWNRACRDEGGGVGPARGWNITVAGNTGTGKSVFGLNLAASAVRHGEQVAYHSLEMSQAQLVTRTLAIVSGISVRRLERGSDYSEADWRTASLRMEEIREQSGGGLFVNEGPIHRLEDVVAAIRYQTEYHGCRFHVVDYLQLCRVAGAKDVVDAIPVVSENMRVLAKELGLVMVGLSQFNRETSKNRQEKPQVQGLMGGSSLENDSDQVILLNHTKYSRNGFHADTEALLAKNRHGECGDIPVRWDYRTLTLTEAMGDAWEAAA
jgi:replicative DNA helicase